MLGGVGFLPDPHLGGFVVGGDVGERRARGNHGAHGLRSFGRAAATEAVRGDDRASGHRRRSSVGGERERHFGRFSFYIFLAPFSPS